MSIKFVSTEQIRRRKRTIKRNPHQYYEATGACSLVIIRAAMQATRKLISELEENVNQCAWLAHTTVLYQ